MSGKGRMARSCKKSGGVVMKDESPKEVYAGKGSKVAAEADKRRDGGKVEGKKAKHQMDRPGRKTGGRIGADTSPLTGAARVSNAKGHASERVYENE